MASFRLPAPTEVFADRYTIDREVGAGGMATVYLATDKKHGRKVALKVLRPELAAIAAERFPREIRMVAQFNHPHIVSMYDSGESQGLLYFVMPYVDGESLRDRLAREKQLPVHDAVRILSEVADALSYAHARGVVHRDIKPANVLLSGRHAVVTDFGVAKALTASRTEEATTVGIVLGTPQYMAPEQAMGETQIDHRADIYALGILGYEMLSGHPPFEATSAQGLLAAQVLAAPADLQQVRPGTPALLSDAIMRCLAKNAADRWQSADELIARIETIAATPSGGTTPTHTRPFHATGARPGHRRPWFLGAAAAVIVVAAAVGALVMNKAGGSGRIDKIGVMPIEDISGKDSVFVAAMHDALTNALSRNGLAGVAPRSAMMRYKGGAKTTREVATEMELGAVVEATVFRAGDVMRINVQLTDPVTSRSLWSDTYERNVSDVLAAQSDVVEKIATGIRGALSTPRKPGGGT